MFDEIITGLFALPYFLLLCVGSVLILFGLFSYLVPKFDSTFRLFLLTCGVLCLLLVIILDSGNKQTIDPIRLYGCYESKREAKISLCLMQDGNFTCDSTICSNGMGSWRLRNDQLILESVRSDNTCKLILTVLPKPESIVLSRKSSGKRSNLMKND